MALDTQMQPWCQFIMEVSRILPAEPNCFPEKVASLRFGNRQELRSDDSTQQFPDWAKFLIQLGYSTWQETRIEREAAQFSVLLVPTRTLVSHLIAFGSILSSVFEPVETLSWAQLEALPCETPVHLVVPEVKGLKSKLTRARGLLQCAPPSQSGHGRMVRITAPQALVKRSTVISVTPQSLARYNLRLEAPPPAATQENMVETADFYNIACGHCTQNWMYYHPMCSFIITNRADWSRQIAAMRVKVTSAEGISRSIRLEQALAPSKDLGHPGAKTGVISEASIDSLNVEGRLVILDGALALRHWEEVLARAFIAVVAESEYDEVVHNRILQMISNRIDTQPNCFPQPKPPVGVQLHSFLVQSCQ